MLQAIRDRATGWIAYGIIGFLIIPFAFWGIDQYQGGGQVNVAEVNGNDITLQEFQRAYQEQQARLSQLLGGQLDPAMLDDNRLKLNTLRQLVDERLMAHVAVAEGYRIGDQQLAAVVRELPTFQGDGGFDSERYERLLQLQGLSPSAFEEQMRVDMARAQMQTGIQSTAAVTAGELDALIELVEQTREVEFLRLSLAAYSNDVSVDETELSAWFEENKEAYRAPERAKFLYVELDAEKMAAEIPVQEEELTAYYEEQKGRYTREEERSASHVLASLEIDADEEAVSQAQARIEEIETALRDGSLTFDEAMAQAGEDTESMLEAGDLGVVAPGMMDSAVEEALFALVEPGDVSEPVRSEFGFHLLRLDAVEEGSQVPLAEIEDELRAELQLQRAENEFFELADELANVAYENPGSLDAAAEAINVEVSESDWTTADAGEGVAAEPAVRAAVFSDEVLREGVNSEPLELSSTRLVVLRLLEHEPAAPRELAEVREEVEQAYREEKASATIAEAATEALAAAREGQSLEEMADGDFKEWVQPVWIGRQGSPGTPPAVVSQAFRLPRAEPGKAEFATTTLGNGDQVVMQLLAVKDGDPGAADEAVRTRLADQMKQQYGGEQWQSTMEALRTRSDIETYPDQL